MCSFLSRALFALSVVLGFVAPTFAGSPDAVRTAAQAAVQTRSFSCAGFGFHPVSSQTAYNWSERVLFRSYKEGDGWFMCAANLPHRAKVTRVRFTVKDSSDDIDLQYCGLIRTPLTVTGQIQAMAIALSGTGMSSEPGIIRPSTTSISFPRVDNANFAYSLQCHIVFSEALISLASPEAGIIGADITYTISAANG